MRRPERRLDADAAGRENADDPPSVHGQTDLDVLLCPLHLYAYRWSDGASTSSAGPIRTYPVRGVDGELVVEVQRPVVSLSVIEISGIQGYLGKACLS